MSTAFVQVDMSRNTKQEPPCETPGGGDLTSKQRRVELGVLRLKSPVAQGSPRSRGRSQKYHAPGVAEVRRRASSLQERVQSPRDQLGGRGRVAPRRRSMPPDVARVQQDAGRRICQAFALKGWRSQRLEAARLRAESTQLAEQLGGVRRQTATLRLLLDDEKLRVATAQQDAQRLTSLLDEGLEDQSQLIKELELIDAHLEDAEQRWVAANEVRTNFQNDLFTAKASWGALDGLVARNEAQLARLRADKVQLLGKMAARSQEISAQQAELGDMQRRSEELQSELNAQLEALRIAEKEVTSERSDELETQHAQLLAEAAAMCAQRENLSALLTAQVQQIALRDKEIGDLESELSSNADKEVDLRARIAQVAARLSVTWYARLGGALRNMLLSWVRSSAQLL